MQAPHRIVRQVVGWSLIALGMLMGFVPMVPGLLLIAIGAVLLAPHVRLFRRVSAWVHKHLPHLRGPLRRFRDFKVRHRPYGRIVAEPDSKQNGLANRAGPAQSDHANSSREQTGS